MFNLRGVFLDAFTAVQTGFTRLKEGIGKLILRLARPQNHSRCHIRDPMDNLRDHVLVLTGGGTLDKEANACPNVFPVVTPLIDQGSPQDPGKKGAQSARALFLNPFQPLSPMGVFEISSNAYSLPFHGIGTTGFPSGELHSPLPSEGSDTLFTPLFDLLSSPTAASTAPTTPDPDLVRLGLVPNEIEAQSLSGMKASHSDDDIPLSALMIRGVAREAAKRNGVSGVLLSKRKDVPLWVPQPTLPNLQISPSLTVESEHWVEVDISTGKADGSGPDVADTEGKPLQTGLSASVRNEAIMDEDPNPFDWYDAWLRTDPSSSVDEKSVYSLGSYISGPSTPAQKQSPARVPQITLTPPSAATSPNLPSYNAVKMGSKFEDSPRVSAIADGSLTASLLVPFLDAPLRHRDDDASEEDEDEAAVKRRRRNGCRLNTSSIDIIMAGLDQEFPDTPIPSPMLGPVDQGEETITPAQEIEDLPSARTSVYSPSSPATTVRNSLNIADLSGDTLLFGDDPEPESKFSDSSDDEDEPRHPKLIAAVPVKYSRLSWPASQLLGPSALLSTIVEEDEDSPLACHNIVISDSRSERPILSPSAVIINSKVGEPEVFLPAAKVPKKRWYSMIEDNKKHQGQPLTGNPGKKRLSAPASVLRPSRNLVRTGGLSLENPKSVVRSLNPPDLEVVKRPSTPAFGVSGDIIGSIQGISAFGQSVEYELPSLPSSRSSNCISLYQRPWPLYVPGEGNGDAQPSSGTIVNSLEHLDIGDPDSPESNSSAFSTPTISEVDTPDAAALTLGSGNDGLGMCNSTEPIDLSQDATFHLFAECSSSEIQGVGGILAILDSLDMSSSDRYPTAVSPTRPRASTDWEGISDLGECSPTGGRHEECDLATTKYRCNGWRDSDFMAYYEGPSCASSVEGVEEDSRASC